MHLGRSIRSVLASLRVRACVAPVACMTRALLRPPSGSAHASREYRIWTVRPPRSGPFERERTKNANQNTYMLTSASGHHLTDVTTTVNRKLFRWRKRKRPNNWFSGMVEFAGFAATPRPPRGRPEAAAPAPSRHWHSPGSAPKPDLMRCSELEIFLFNSAPFNLTVDRTRGALRIVR